MSAGRANYQAPQPPPPPLPTTTTTAHINLAYIQNPTEQTSPVPAPAPPLMMQLPPRDTLPELPQVGSDKAWVVIKMVLRAICLTAGLLLCVIALAMLGMVYPNTTLYISLPIGLLSLSWNGAEFITLCARRNRRRGMTPKAHVGADLVIWCLGVAGSILQGLYMPDIIMVFGGSGQYRRLQQTCIGLLAILGILEFSLFVRSCIEVDRKKKDLRIQQLVIALQMQREQQQQQLQQLQQGQGQLPQMSQVSQQQHHNLHNNNNLSSPPSTTDYDRELNIKYYGPMPEPLDDPRDLQKVLIIDPRLRGIVN